MIRQELFIEGRRVDLGSLNISLEFVSNMLSSVDKITASHSYTISLPTTTNNVAILDYCISVSHQSSAVGRYLAAEYRRNGITILKDAKAYVTAVNSESISICLLWDGLASVSTWLAGAPSLKDLYFQEHIWRTTPSDWTHSLDAIVQARYDTGVRSDLASPPPSVNVWSIFEQIMNGIGRQWDFPAPAQYELKRLVIPLASRAGARTPQRGGLWNGVTASGESPVSGLLSVLPTDKTYGDMAATGERIPISDTFASVDISVNAAWTAPTDVYDDIYVMVYGSNGSVLAEYSANVDGATISLNESFSLDVSSLSWIAVRITAPYDDIEGGYATTLPAEGVLSVIPTTKQAVPLSYYDIAANIPDISQLDFIKAVCNLFGLHLVQRSDGWLDFVSADDWYSRKDSGDVADWSDKFVYADGVPYNAEFSFGDYARKNWMRYKADAENLGYDADSFFSVNSDLLAAEKDAYSLPFAATRGNRVGIYSASYNDEDGWVVKDEKTEPRILRTERGTDGKVEIVFHPSLNWDAIIASRYKGLRKVLEYPVQIRAYVRLTEIDFSVLDWTRPVYLRQTGRYYAVSVIKTDATTEISEVTLIQL